MQDKFRENAEFTIETVKQKLGISLAYDEASVAWLDGYVNRQRGRLDPDAKASLISVLGSFLGECIRQQYGGEWEDRPEGWAISFDENNCVFPFNKLQKHFDQGPEDSVLSFYQMIPKIYGREGPGQAALKT